MITILPCSYCHTLAATKRKRKWFFSIQQFIYVTLGPIYQSRWKKIFFFFRQCDARQKKYEKKYRHTYDYFYRFPHKIRVVFVSIKKIQFFVSKRIEWKKKPLLLANVRINSYVYDSMAVWTMGKNCFPPDEQRRDGIWRTRNLSDRKTKNGKNFFFFIPTTQKKLELDTKVTDAMGPIAWKKNIYKLLCVDDVQHRWQFVRQRQEWSEMKQSHRRQINIGPMRANR